MLSLRTLLATTATLSILALPAIVASGTGAAARPLVTAQSDAPADPTVAAAIQKVEQARADLRDAMAKGGDVRGARRALNEALKQLNDARVASGQPADKSGESAKDETQETPPADQPKAAETPPSGEKPAVTTGEDATPPKLGKKPPKPTDTAEEPAKIPVPPKAEVPPTETPEPALTDIAPSGNGSQTPKFDKKPPQFDKKPPRIGQPPQEAQLPPLPKSSNDIREGQAVEAEDGRTILREGGQLTIRHDDDSRFQGDGRVQVESAADGGSKTIVTRPNGVKIVTLRDPDGNILERYRQMPDGQVVMLIGNNDGPPPPPPPVLDPSGRGFRPPPMAGGGNYDFDRYLPPVRVPIPRDDYIVESQDASPDQIEEALAAPPIERVERPYTLDEIRRSYRLRAKLRRIDVDTITFDFGQATVPDDQIDKLQIIGGALQRVIRRDPSEVFLIEGHTDAVGSDVANLALSDRRAESVAEILTDYFNIPPENLVTQGYGEQYLKIPTDQPERENRRVTLRRITPLLNARQ